MTAANLTAQFTPSFFRRLQQLKIRTRRSFLGSRQGSHLSHRKGQGLEFSDYRQYAPGDDFRHIDWGVFGRTDRLYVREFREEQDLNVMVVLDCSSSMAYPEGEKKFELARMIALALGYVALTDGDTVTFSRLGQRNSPRFSGPRAVQTAAQFLNEATPQGSFDLKAELRGAVSRHKIPGKCFVVSDFMQPADTIFKAIDVLRYRNFEIALIQVLAPGELELKLDRGLAVIDAESGEEIELALDGSSAQEYKVKLAQHINALERYCIRYGISHLLVSSDEQISDVVLMRFPQAGLLQ